MKVGAVTMSGLQQEKEERSAYARFTRFLVRILAIPVTTDKEFTKAEGVRK